MQPQPTDSLSFTPAALTLEDTFLLPCTLFPTSWLLDFHFIFTFLPLDHELEGQVGLPKSLNVLLDPLALDKPCCPLHMPHNDQDTADPQHEYCR